MTAIKTCQYCQKALSRDEIGLSKKLFEPETKRSKFTCLSCMAEILEVTIDDLLAKIEEFKAAGCKLFK
jgi:hypothetical protein